MTDRTKPLRGLHKPLRVLLAIYAGVTALVVAACVALIATGNAGLLAEDAAYPETTMQLVMLGTVSLGWIASLGLLVVCIFFVARWTFRAMRNLQAQGAEAAEMSAGWAVGWYFVPLFHL